MKEYLVQSNDTKELDQAIFRIKQKLPDIPHNRNAVGRTRSGKDVSYSYTDLPKLLSIFDPLFKEENLLFEAMEVGDGHVMIQMKLIRPEGAQYSGSIHRIYDISQDYPHQRASALTTARRLFLCGKFGIHPASDDDGNASQGNDVKESLGEFQAGKVADQLADMHEKIQQKPFIVSDNIPREETEVSEIIAQMKEYQIETMIKFDKRRHKSLELFVGLSPRSLLVQSVNAALNKLAKSK